MRVRKFLKRTKRQLKRLSLRKVIVSPITVPLWVIHVVTAYIIFFLIGEKAELI